MILFRFTFALLVMTFISGFLPSQPKKPVKDYLGIPGPVAFDGKSYSLAWSSHPTDTYYKHEYVPAGETVEKFNSMVLMEVLTGNATPKETAAAKIEELKQMKAANPMVNYDSFNNASTGEYMIDFLLSANGADGKAEIVERNVYRYKSVTTKSGKKALLLFASSTRSYGNAITPFLTSLKAKKSNLVNQTAAFKIPELKSL